MQFLKILFWCLLAFIAAVFTISNWNAVQIQLWGGLIADVNLPMLLLVTFLVGFVPTALYNLALRWRLRQRLATAERTILDLRAAQTPPAGAYPATATPVRTSPAAAPTIPASASTTTTTIAPVPSTTL